VVRASVRRGRGFAPSHVSGIFVPRREARDPRARGSLGAGLVLDVGVMAVAEWRARLRPSVTVTSDRSSPLAISSDVARRLAARRPGQLRVHLTHALPIGQGFGSSAAGALATGLAISAALGLPRRRAVEVAHLADLFGRGGLGGVAAILGGGLEVRLRPGIPPFGRILHQALDRTVWVGTAGPAIRSPTVLGRPGTVARFAAGERLFEAFVAEPGWERFWETSERFTDEVRVASPRLRAVLAGLRRRGVRAAQGMFGQSFVAYASRGEARREVAAWFRRGGVPHQEVRLARSGARILPFAHPDR
jgi:pantoate kinase